MNKTINKPVKPLSVAREEFCHSLLDLVNNSGLPAFSVQAITVAEHCFSIALFSNSLVAFADTDFNDPNTETSESIVEDIEEELLIEEEKIISPRVYHTITEVKNGAGAVPIKTNRGWIHISHGVRNTADGLRYVLYVYATALDDPSLVIAEPSGVFLVPLGRERTGDVSNVVFTNGAIVNKEENVFIYYASSDTRMHVATTTLERLKDYVFNTPSDPLRSVKCVEQRCELIKRNLEYMNK